MAQLDSSHTKFNVLNGILYHPGKPYLGKDSSLKQLFYRNFKYTYGRSRRNHKDFIKTQGKHFLGKYALGCHNFCLFMFLSADEVRTSGSLQVVAANPSTFSRLGGLTNDFIVNLPTHQGQRVFMVVDRFSKAAHFGTLPTHISACKAAEIFTHMVCKLHGYPRSIISAELSATTTQFSLVNFGKHCSN